MGKCNCEICQLSRRAENLMLTGDKTDLCRFISELMDMIVNSEEDREYYACILNGTWPQAEEILLQSLEKTKENTRLRSDEETKLHGNSQTSS